MYLRYLHNSTISDAEFGQILRNLQRFRYSQHTEYLIFRHPIFLVKLQNHHNIHKVAAPIIQISATLIRQGIKSNKNVEPMLPKQVWKYIDEMNFYRK